MPDKIAFVILWIGAILLLRAGVVAGVGAINYGHAHLLRFAWGGPWRHAQAASHIFEQMGHYTGQGWVAYLSGQPETAVYFWQLETAPAAERPFFVYLVGRTSLQSGQPAAAGAYWRDRELPPALLLQQATFALRAGDYQAAGDLLTVAHAYLPDTSWAWFLTGRLREAQDDLAGAEDAYRRALALDAHWQDVYQSFEAGYRLGDALRRQGRFVDAIAALTRSQRRLQAAIHAAPPLRPVQVRVRERHLQHDHFYLLGLTYFNQQLYDPALAYFTQAQIAAPERARPRRVAYMALARYLRGDPQAVEALTGVLAEYGAQDGVCRLVYDSLARHDPTLAWQVWPQFADLSCPGSSNASSSQ